jgi:hypothetical protein
VDPSGIVSHLYTTALRTGCEYHRVVSDLQIQTVWKTASEQCEIVWSQFMGYHTRLWVQGRLVLDEWMANFEDAASRAWELRTEWTAFAD